MSTVKFQNPGKLVGKRILWQYRSKTGWVDAEGVVVAVIPAGEYPLDYLPEGARRKDLKGYLLPRRWDSYLVQTDDGYRICRTDYAEVLGCDGET